MTDKLHRADPDPWSLANVVLRVRETIARHGLFAAEQRVLVACSGGPDSVALVALLQRCELSLGMTLGHVDHGLRPDSADDAEAVQALADTLGLDCIQRRLSLAGEADGNTVSEDTMRRGRLAALDEMAAEVGAHHIALGHTADDQLETVLMRLCRGAGLTGLAGMAPRRGKLVRPMLEIGRDDVLATLETLGWTAREDPSNRSRRFFRNRVRRDVVPLLKQENPRLLEAVNRTARGLREELGALTHYEQCELEQLARPDRIGEAVDAAGLSALPRGLSTRLVRLLWRRVRAHEVLPRAEDPTPAELGRHHVEAALALLDRDTGPRVELPGAVVAYRQYDLLVVAPASGLVDPGDVELEVSEPGIYLLPDLGLELEVGEGLERAAPPPWPLCVRNSRSGDRVIGRAGSRKLSDLFVDRKVPRVHRRRLPLLLLRGEIVWIPGVWHREEAVPDTGDLRAHLPGVGVRLLFRGGGLE